ncbi:uncharacterized protein H6S33_004581 [Morchella sextelata]|uniref:uncharacterized protein n=1 Tax=Morchella sextelata TaxID=1174677 RepID=UPI001D048544|nr:uncharacterized protein H6S33_004581 [Morchella sextelata]KAH0605359.1 hypothetical protein H6S33_004581 [Morchella sextelata]
MNQRLQGQLSPSLLLSSFHGSVFPKAPPPGHISLTRDFGDTFKPFPIGGFDAEIDHANHCVFVGFSSRAEASFEHISEHDVSEGAITDTYSRDERRGRRAGGHKQVRALIRMVNHNILDSDDHARGIEMSIA